MGWPSSRADRWADGGGEWLCALLAGAAREMGAMKGFKGTKTPPWRERGGVKGVGKAGNGPDATKGSGTGYGSRGKQRREEWVCTICETPNFLDKNKCRLCTHERAHNAQVIGGKAKGKGSGKHGPNQEQARDRAGKTAKEEGAAVRPQGAATTAGTRADPTPTAEVRANPETEATKERRFSPHKLRKAAAMLRAAGLADGDLVDKVEYATTSADAAPHKKRDTPVGARLDKARARWNALAKRKTAATKSVEVAKTVLREVREEIKSTEELMAALEREVAEGKDKEPSPAERALRKLLTLLSEEPDQAAFAFKSRIILQSAAAEERSDCEETGRSQDEEAEGEDSDMGEPSDEEEEADPEGEEQPWQVHRARGRGWRTAREHADREPGVPDGAACERSPRRHNTGQEGKGSETRQALTRNTAPTAAAVTTAGGGAIATAAHGV